MVLEVGDEVPHVEEVLAGADTRGRGVFDLAQTLWLVHVDFQPEHVELLQHLCDSQRAFGLEVEVEVEVDVDVVADCISECADELLNMRDEPLGGYLVGGANAAAEAAAECGVLAGHDDVGLQRREASVLDLMPQISYGLPGVYGRHAEDVVMAHS